ncbi:MAG: 16S rRNA (guanine(527)-N(7))-methyltransferase RsmG [Desulfohalobium sp.]
MAQPASLPDEAAVAAHTHSLGQPLDAYQTEKLTTYLRLLQQWNRRVNLVGPRHWQTILTRLVADSWHLAELFETLSWPRTMQTLDLGAGAGLPGLPLRLFWTHGTYTLVEIRQKRVAFLHNALTQMELSQTTIHHGRAEELPHDYLPAQLVLSRAFLPWPKLLPLAHSLLATNGRLIILSNTPAAPEMFGNRARLVTVHSYHIENQPRFFWVLEELSP